MARNEKKRVAFFLKNQLNRSGPKLEKT